MSEEFFFVRRYNGHQTAEQQFSPEEIKKAIIEGLCYARSKDSRPNSQKKYNDAIKKINFVVWGEHCFKGKIVNKRD